MTENVARLEVRQRRYDSGRLRSENLRLGRRQLLYAWNIPGARVNKTVVGIEGDGHCVGSTRWPDFDLFTRQKALVYVSQYGPASCSVDLSSPVDFDVWVGGDQLAVRAVQHIHEAVLVRLDHHLPALTTNLEIGKNVLVGAVNVVHVIRSVLKVANDLAGLGPD